MEWRKKHKKNEWRERAVEGEGTAREGAGWGLWLPLLAAIDFLYASECISYFYPFPPPLPPFLIPPPCTQLRHPPYTSSSSHSPSLHHHPSQLPIYFPICRPVSLPYIPAALSHSIHISFPCPIAPSLSMISITLSLAVSLLNSLFLSQVKAEKHRRELLNRQGGWIDKVNDK